MFPPHLKLGDVEPQRLMIVDGLGALTLDEEKATRLALILARAGFQVWKHLGLEDPPYRIA